MEGQRFITRCAEAGKKVLVWTVNKQEEMMEVCASRFALGRKVTGDHHRQ